MKKQMIKISIIFLFLLLLFIWGCNTAPPINQPPVITSIPVTIAPENVPYTYDVDAIDPDGDPLTYTLALSPVGMTIDPDTGLITWNHDPWQGTDAAVTVEVTDGVDTVSQDFVITFPSSNEYPVHNVTKGTDYSTIQDAIDDAGSGDLIEVDVGTYYENIEFNGKNIILRSTDPSDPAIVADTIIDGENKDSVVKFLNGDQSTLEGFTIRNGDAYFGGGIYLYDSFSTITGNNIIENKSQIDGGGIYLNNSFPIMTGNSIFSNEAKYGAGIYVDSSSPDIINNRIYDNVADYKGGGILVIDNSYPLIKDNELSGNAGKLIGGGIYVSFHCSIFPADIRPNGWGGNREDIPSGSPLVPEEGIEYFIAGNKFLGNKQGDPLDYTKGAHVYFEKNGSIL